MGVKAGYKQTEVGVIPEDWDIKPLFKLAEEIGDGIHATPQYVKRSDFFFVNGNNLLDGRIQVSKNTMCVDETEYQKLRKILNGQTILISINGTIGNLAYFNGEKIILGKSAAYITLSENISKFYIFYSIASAATTKYFDNELTGTTIKNLSLVSLRNTPIPLPKTDMEQRTIATSLSDVDAHIISLEKIIAKKRDLKQATMQELLTGKRRLKGFSEKWEFGRLGDCLSERPQYGINAPAVPYSDGLPTYIRITDITEDGRFSRENPVSVESGDSPDYYLKDGDLIFARTGASVGKSYLYNPNDGPLIFAGFLIRIRPNPQKLIPTFISEYVNTNSYWNWVHQMSMRSGQPGINGNEYSQLPIPQPKISEQRAIATVLSDMDAEIAALEQQRDKTRSIKQGMMQELLTGRIRLV